MGLPAPSELLDLPEIKAIRGGATIDGTSGWCAPLDGMAGVPLAPQVCSGDHRWERLVSSSQCDCPQCHYSERYVECIDCAAVVREGEPGFEELWDGATW